MSIKNSQTRILKIQYSKDLICIEKNVSDNYKLKSNII